jgi:RNA polymerase sigma-70 factor, ECF subfamily
MEDATVEEVTQTLRLVRAGDKDAQSRLMSIVYTELYAMAARLMRKERPDHTLQPTALVNEAYLRLVARSGQDWKDRAHFFGAAAQVMRHVLVDHARQRLAGKRGGGVFALSLDDCLAVAPDRLEQLLILEDALNKLEEVDPRALRVVVLRFFGGLTLEEIAGLMNLATRTIRRDWNYGRTWLKAELSRRPAHAARAAQSS